MFSTQAIQSDTEVQVETAENNPNSQTVESRKVRKYIPLRRKDENSNSLAMKFSSNLKKLLMRYNLDNDENKK